MSGISINGVQVDTSQLTAKLESAGVDVGTAIEASALTNFLSTSDVYVPSDPTKAASVTLYDKTGKLVGTEQIQQQGTLQPQQEEQAADWIGKAIASGAISWAVGQALSWSWNNRESLVQNWPGPILYMPPNNPSCPVYAPTPVPFPAPAPSSTADPTQSPSSDPALPVNHVRQQSQ